MAHPAPDCKGKIEGEKREKDAPMLPEDDNTDGFLYHLAPFYGQQKGNVLC